LNAEEFVRYEVIKDSLSYVRLSPIEMLDHMLASYDYVVKTLFLMNKEICMKLINEDINYGSRTQAFATVCDIKLHELENKIVENEKFGDILTRIKNAYSENDN
jgi:hypothetical protein